MYRKEIGSYNSYLPFKMVEIIDMMYPSLLSPYFVSGKLMKHFWKFFLLEWMVDQIALNIDLSDRMDHKQFQGLRN